MSSSELTPEQRKAETLAKLFDLRMFIGSLFVVFGVIVTIDGFLAGPEEIAKAAGINLSLWTGLIMLVVGIVFVAWTLLSPPDVFHGHEMSEDDLPEQLRHTGLEVLPEHRAHQEEPLPPRRRSRPPNH
jgi:hypothetical protein